MRPNRGFLLRNQKSKKVPNRFLKSILQNQKTNFSLSEIRHLKTKIRNPFEIRNPKSETRNPKPEIGNQKSEIRNQKSDIRNQKSEIRNRKSEIGNRKSENGNQKSEIGNKITSHLRDVGYYVGSTPNALYPTILPCMWGGGRKGGGEGMTEWKSYRSFWRERKKSLSSSQSAAKKNSQWEKQSKMTSQAPHHPWPHFE